MRPHQFFADPCFENGFDVHGARHEEGIVACYPGFGAAAPRWQLAQWGVYKNPLTAATPRIALPDGGYAYSTPTITVEVHPAGGDCLLRLEQRTLPEYGPRPRQRGEDWPHLLIDQLHLDEGAPALGELHSLTYTAALRLEYCRCHATPAQLDAGLHTAQVSHYFTVADPATGDYFWFGIPYFDARWPSMPPQLQIDGGKPDCTQKMIACDAQTVYTHATAASGAWLLYQKDILPLMRDAMAAAQAKGVLTGSRFEEMKLTSTNLGFEMPGTYDAAIQLRSLSLVGA